MCDPLIIVKEITLKIILIRFGNKKKNKILAGAYHLDAFYLVEAGKMWAGLAAYARAFAKHPPTALKSWKRILYAFLSLFGFARVREIYTKKKQKKIEREL